MVLVLLLLLLLLLLGMTVGLMWMMTMMMLRRSVTFKTSLQGARTESEFLFETAQLGFSRV